MSSVSSQGPSVAVAFSWPSFLACWANSAMALGGTPSRSAGSVTSFLKALVESSRLLLNLVDSWLSSCWIALKHSFCSPCQQYQVVRRAFAWLLCRSFDDSK